MINLKLKKREILGIYGAMTQIGNQKADVNFAYAIAKNKKTLEPEVTALQEAGKPSEEYIAYENERMKIATKYAQKDEKGNPVMKGNGLFIEPANVAGFDKESEKLNDKHKKVIAEQEKRNKDVETLLNTEMTVELYPIKFDSVPKEITPLVVEILLPLIVVDEEKK
jgi:hypothetical protein